MQMYDIGLGKCLEPCDVVAKACRVYCKQSLATKAVLYKYL